MTTTITYFPKDTFTADQLTYVVMIARYKNQWLLVRHRDRTTWEVPGGHIEPGEPANEAAARELFEETGATAYTLSVVCDYSVTQSSITRHGRLYYAYIKTLGPLPESEIAEVKRFAEIPENLTYLDIHPALLTQYLNTQ